MGIIIGEPIIEDKGDLESASHHDHFIVHFQNEVRQSGD